MSDAQPTRPMAERQFGRYNLLGLWTLIRREVARFTSVWTQTLAAPVVTAGIFMAVFSLAFAARRAGAEGAEAFTHFIAPGILMMQVIQNAFANTSSSLMVAKVQGNIVDTLMPPLSAAELTVGYAAGGVVRGLIVAAAISATVFPVIGLGIAHPLWALAFVLLGATLMALLGTLAAIVAQKFDHIAAITNFIVMPLSFLSGTFYSISILPGWMQAISHVNPFFYMIDGIRFGVLGVSDTGPWAGVAVLLLVDAALGVLTWWWFRTGYRLKA
ncbi:multidrug ABC transporter permease [Rhodobacteraceae bacterium 2CG4]|uniref:Transport permease protein n=1 Tax=Halovulum marinum TaxID=2662447 RepID=A0A6L5Z4N7_9RHOB|nr:ABC transporter permease [Halovulum marinum]MSU91518.1 multidrug ABC transporter permease [Halovulum marinum]